MKIKKIEDGQYIFLCPGCDTHHWFRTKAGEDESVWKKSGGDDDLTVKPAISAYPTRKESFCSLTITNGKIKFHKDCHHDLAGKTVDMVDADAKTDPKRNMS